MRKPKYFNSLFAVKVVNAYDNGELDYYNITEWETKYNDGIKPVPSLGTLEILDYYTVAGKDPRDK